MSIEHKLSLEAVIENLLSIQSMQSSRPWRLVIKKTNPGGLTGHQTTEIESMYAGFDWEAGKVVLCPVKPLTELTSEQIEAIQKSVRTGESWHAYERAKKLHARIAELEAEVKELRARF